MLDTERKPEAVEKVVHDAPLPPPDGGFGWVVLVCVFMSSAGKSSGLHLLAVMLMHVVFSDLGHEHIKQHLSELLYCKQPVSWSNKLAVHLCHRHVLWVDTVYCSPCQLSQQAFSFQGTNDPRDLLIQRCIHLCGLHDSDLAIVLDDWCHVGFRLCVCGLTSSYFGWLMTVLFRLPQWDLCSSQ